MSSTFFSKVFPFLLFLFCISACSTLNSQGYFLDSATLTKLKDADPKSLDYVSVQQILGPPNIVVDQNHWYYIYREVRKTAFFASKVKKQIVHSLVFNSDGILENFNIQEDLPEIFLIDSYSTQGHSYSNWEHFRNNIGRKYSKKSSSN